jgi:hypothetical protein
MSPENAEIIALQALGWLASNEELCPTFLGATGGSTDEMRSRATDPAYSSRWTMHGSSNFVTAWGSGMTSLCGHDMHCLAHRK